MMKKIAPLTTLFCLCAAGALAGEKTSLRYEASVPDTVISNPIMKMQTFRFDERDGMAFVDSAAGVVCEAADKGRTPPEPLCQTLDETPKAWAGQSRQILLRPVQDVKKRVLVDNFSPRIAEISEHQDWRTGALSVTFRLWNIHTRTVCLMTADVMETESGPKELKRQEWGCYPVRSDNKYFYELLETFKPGTPA